MVYESQISFTLDTICPWTYLAKKRLDEGVNFTIRYFPYQLYPESSKQGEDKYEWYKKAKYDNSEEKMQKYVALMTAYGKDVGIDFDFHGIIANTIDAHRLIQHCQEELGPNAADKAINSLYTQYFTQQGHPAGPSILLEAAAAAGVSRERAEAFVADEYEALAETRMLLQEQVSNGVDSVPYVTFEGKRRDFTLVGAKEISEYLKVLENVSKEAS